MEKVLVNAGDITPAIMMLKIFREIVQNLVARANRRPGFVHPYLEDNPGVLPSS
jgi:hypothetical protein